ncbi:MAG: hypothetical protein LBR83_10480, partial [Clostridiales bacterium]|nr:hypothetical protein [Clostridiales bacterium]
MKNLKRLKTKKGRDELNQFIVEGEKTVNEIPEDWKIAYFVCAERYAPSLSRYQRRAEVKILRDSLFDAVCDTKTPQGVLAVCEQKHFSMGEVIKPRSFLL